MNLQIEDVRVAYGRTEIVFGVSLDVPDGSLTCLMGRNGVGKSTLLNAAMGLLPVRSGTIRLDGTDVTKLAAHKRARMGIGYVPQGHQVFPHLTVRENLQVVTSASLDPALELFPALGGLLDRQAGLLSGGQAQQLAIGRALVTKPKLLILDEPTEGIQPSIILEIEDAIAKLHKEGGMSILLVEQYVEFALRLSERYAVMDGGRITHSGTTDSVELASFADLLAV